MSFFTENTQPAPSRDVISVTSLNRMARSLLENHFPNVIVEGEISNLSMPGSGHWYLTLKDEGSQIRCAMFRNRNMSARFRPRDGMQVIVRGRLSIYEGRGDYQLIADAIEEAGDGALRRRFEMLKQKLAAEGLFAEERKRAMPEHVRHIGVITSATGAVIRDIVSVLGRRFPAIRITLIPVVVQGTEAPAAIVRAIAIANRRREELGLDVLIVGRGGGSLEDLQAFNEESVARAIHDSALPIVSAVGHETDFTIADFVADARAPTPTAAAQMASPNRDDLRQDLSHLYQRLARVTERALERRMQQLDVLARRLTHPGERIANQLLQLGHLASRLRSAWQLTSGNSEWRLRELYQQLLTLRPDFAALATGQQALARRLVSAAAHRVDGLRADLKSLSAQLSQLNPRAVLERGYSMVETGAGDIVRDSAQLSADDEVRLTFARGWASAKVREKG